MDFSKRIKLLKNYDALCDDLSVCDEISPQLVSKGVILPNELDAITSEPTRLRQVIKLLDHVVKKGNHGYDGLREVMRDLYPWLVDGLDNTQVTDSDLKLYSALFIHLPPPVQNFTGRQGILTAIEGLLLQESEGSPKILTITGGPGFGKSSSAIMVANFLRVSRPSIFVDLRSISGVTAIVQKILQLFGVDLDRADAAIDRTNQLCHLLRNLGQKLLLIFDNAEDALIPSIGAQFYNLLFSLLAVENVQVICTSREKLLDTRLRVVDTPLDEMSPEEAKDLIYKICGETSDSDVEKLMKISGCCPLALILVAKLKNEGFTTEELFQELVISGSVFDMPDDHQQLKSCFGLSYTRLSSGKQDMFARISIFPSTFDVKAAAAVTEMSTFQARAGLNYLSQRSLVAHDKATDRFNLHPLLKTYGYQELQSHSQVTITLKRFINYYINYLLELNDRYHSKESANAISEFQQEYSNFTLVVQNVAKDESWNEMFSKLYTFMLLVFVMRFMDKELYVKFLTEARKDAEERQCDELPQILAALALSTLTVSDPVRAVNLLEEALGLYASKSVSENRIHQIYCEVMLGTYLKDLGRLQEAVEIKDKIVLPEVTDNMSNQDKVLVAVIHGMYSSFLTVFDQSKAMPISRKALQILEEVLGPHPEKAYNMNHLIDKLIDSGKEKEAEALADEVLSMAETHNIGVYILAQSCYQKARLTYLKEETRDQALLLLVKARSLMESIGLGHVSFAADLVKWIGTVLSSGGKYDEAEKKFGEAIGMYQSLGHAYCSSQVYCYTELASMCQKSKSYDKAHQACDTACDFCSSRGLCNNGCYAEVCNVKGHIFYSQEMYEQSALWYNKAINVADRCGKNNDFAYSCYRNNIANSYLNMKKYDLAVEEHRFALHLRDKILGVHLHTVDSLRGLGRALREGGEFEEAMGHFERAMVISRNLGNIDAFRESCLGMLKTRVKQGKGEDAEKCLDEAISCMRGDQYPESEVAKLHREMGGFYHDKGNHNASLKHFREAVRILKEADLTNTKDCGLYLNKLGDKLRDLEMYDEAETVLMDAFAIQQGLLGDHDHTQDTLNALAGLYRKTDNFTMALQMYEASAEMCKRLPDIPRKYLAHRYSDIGTMHQRKGEPFAVFAEWHQKAIEYCLDSNITATDTLGKAYGDFSLSLAYFGNLDMAKEYSDKAAEIFEKNGDINTENGAMHYHNLAFIYYDNSKWVPATENFAKSLEIRKNVVGDHPITADTYTMLGRCYQKREMYWEALDMFNEALRLQKLLNRTTWIKATNDEIKTILSKMH